MRLFNTTGVRRSRVGLLEGPERVCIYVCMVITYSKSKDQPGKVTNPARGQLNRENEYFPVPVRAREFGTFPLLFFMTLGQSYCLFDSKYKPPYYIYIYILRICK